MFKYIAALHPPFLSMLTSLGLSLVSYTYLSITLGCLLAFLACVFAADTAARYRDFRYVLSLTEIDKQALYRYRGSWCQRTLMKTAHPFTIRRYYGMGYRWYHLLPDGFVSIDTPLLKYKWYLHLLWGTKRR